MTVFITAYPQFFTATITEWQKLLEPDKYKDIIINSLRFLVEDKRIKLYAFVIMSNHIHLFFVVTGVFLFTRHETIITFLIINIKEH
jgi:REP element-mobilizing transposase RayT